MEKLKNCHLNKDCVILTCGPSLTEYPKDIIKKFLKDKIVICIKESVIEYKNEADYFISNGTRDRIFDFNKKTIKIYQLDTVNKPKNNVDITFEEDHPFDIHRQLLRAKNFETYNFNNSIKRPWGPGILYETVFYMCLYMGFKNVYTIGWDLIDTKTTSNVTHYFEDYNSDEYKNSLFWKNHDFRQEMDLINNTISYFYDYLKKKGMNLFVIGEKSYVNKYIPRKSLL